MKQLDDNIARNEEAVEAANPIKVFSPAFGQRTIIGGTPDRTDVGFKSLLDHTMDHAMNPALTDKIKADKKEIERAAREAEPKFDKKIEDCGKI